MDRRVNYASFKKELEKPINKPTSTVMHCSVCQTPLVFKDKSIKPLVEDGWRHQIWHVSPCEVCMDKVKSSVKALSTALKELTECS